MVTRRPSRQFRAAIDERVDGLLKELRLSGLTPWLFFEHVFDSWEAATAFPKQVAKARQLYHLRVQSLADDEPDALMGAFLAATRSAKHGIGPGRTRIARQPFPFDDDERTPQDDVASGTAVHARHVRNNRGRRGGARRRSD